MSLRPRNRQRAANDLRKWLLVKELSEPSLVWRERAERRIPLSPKATYIMVGGARPSLAPSLAHSVAVHAEWAREHERRTLFVDV